MTPLSTVVSSASKREAVSKMSDLIPLTGVERSAYRPEPCHVCGSRARVIGWEDVTVLKDGEQKWLPNRRCTDQGCPSNAGVMKSPPA